MPWKECSVMDERLIRPFFGMDEVLLRDKGDTEG
jgi:hypothetical protein